MTDLILLATTVISFGCIVVMVSRKLPLLLAVPSNLINESFVIRPSKAKVVWDHIAEWFTEKHYIIWLLFFFEVLLKVFHVVFSSVDSVFYWLFRKVRSKKVEYLSHIESGYWKYPAHWRRAAEKKTEMMEVEEEEDVSSLRHITTVSSDTLSMGQPLVDNIIERQWPLK